MSGVNKVILVGHLGRDPEMRRTGAGDPVVTFSIATSDTWRDKATGERKERTEWHNVVIYNEGLGKIADAYLKKGSSCYLEGKLRTRAYTDRDGNERKTTEVVLKRFNGELVLLNSGQRAAPDSDSYGKVSAKPTQAQLDDPREAMGSPAKSTADFINDDIPF